MTYIFIPQFGEKVAGEDKREEKKEKKNSEKEIWGGERKPQRIQLSPFEGFR